MALTAHLAWGARLGPQSIPSTGRLLALVLPMAMAMYAAFQGCQYVLLPIQLQAIDAPHKVANMATIVAITAVTGALGMVAGGWATDVTRSRWGGRTPWLLAMGLASVALYLPFGFATSVGAVAFFAAALWFTLNFFQGAMLTVLPARVSERDRAFALAFFAVGGPIGGLAGYQVAALVGGAWGYIALATAFLALLALFLVFAPETEAERNRLAKTIVAAPDSLPSGTFASFRRRDFLLAFVFRLAIFSGQAAILNYLVYYLIDRIGLSAIPSRSAEIGVGQIAGMRTICTLVGLALGMVLVRRTANRKMFLQAYALVMGGAMLLPVFAPNWTSLLVYGGLGGLAMGFYSTVDLHLMSAVLPNPRTKGRDMGMLAMTGALGQLVGPPLASVAIQTIGYSAMFELAAFITLGGGIAAGFLRSVR